MQKYQTIPEFLADLEPDKRNVVDKLRALILDLGFELVESIKWNAPNYSYKGVDRITFNLMNKEGKVKLVIHMGAVKKEDKKAKPVLQNYSHLIDWNSDIRGTISFDGLDDVKQKSNSLREALTQWLEIS